MKLKNLRDLLTMNLHEIISLEEITYESFEALGEITEEEAEQLAIEIQEHIRALVSVGARKVFGYDIYVNDGFDKFLGVPNAMLFIFPLSEENQNFIICHSHIMNGPVELFAPVIAHEIGHVLIKDVASSEERLEYIHRGEVHPVELRADEHAVKMCGAIQTIRAFEHLMTFIPEDELNGVFKKEVELRIEIIKQKGL